MNRWNNLFWRLIVTNIPEMRTVQLALTLECRSLQAFIETNFPPVLVLYMFSQRYFTQGIALAGMKG